MRKTEGKPARTVGRLLARILLVQIIKWALIHLMSKALLRSIAQTAETNKRRADLARDQQFLDTASSASRQHFIDAGSFLKPGEAMEA